MIGERVPHDLLDEAAAVPVEVGQQQRALRRGASVSRCSPCAIALRVVSTPATSSSEKNEPSSREFSRLPSTFGGDQRGDQVVGRVAGGAPARRARPPGAAAASAAQAPAGQPQPAPSGRRRCARWSG